MQPRALVTAEEAGAWIEPPRGNGAIHAYRFGTDTANYPGLGLRAAIRRAAIGQISKLTAETSREEEKQTMLTVKANGKWSKVFRGGEIADGPV